MSYCLRIKVLPNRKIKYQKYAAGSVMEHLALFLERPGRCLWARPPHHVEDPSADKHDITTATLAKMVAMWRREAVDVVVIDERTSLREIRLPSGTVLTAISYLLDLVRALAQWQRGQLMLENEEGMALKLWIAERAPFGMDALENIKNMNI